MFTPKKRITQKEIVIKERTFIIKKVDALTGCYIAGVMASKLLPAGISGYTGIELPQSNQTMSKEEFASIQKDILSCVFEKLESGLVEVFDDAGHFRITDIDSGLLLRLTIDSLQLNFADFFDESLWKGLIPEPILLILSKPLTSTNLFSHLSRMVFGNKENSGTEHTT